jgi:hypothetical protein
MARSLEVRISMANRVAQYLYIILLFVATSVQPVSSRAQTGPEVQWQRCLGGLQHDQGDVILTTHDGGYAVIGATNCSDEGDVSTNHGGSDIWLVKLSAVGTIEWNRCIGGSADEYPMSAIETPDGGFVIVGRTDSPELGTHLVDNRAAYDALVVRTDQTGQVLWRKTLGGTADDRANGVCSTQDGGFAVIGTTASADGDVIGNHSTNGYTDAWLLKFTADGTLSWTKCVGSKTWDRGDCITQLRDGSYAIGGYAESFDSGSTVLGLGLAWLARLDTAGHIVWNRMLGGSNGISVVLNLLERHDGSIIATGTNAGGAVLVPRIDSSYYYRNPQDCGVACVSPNGDLLWQRRVGGTSFDEFFGATLDSENGVVASGLTSSRDGTIMHNHGGYSDVWLVRFDSTGGISWQGTYGGSDRDEARSVVATPDGGYAVVGYTNSLDGDVSGYHDQNGFDAWFVKLGKYDAVPYSRQGIPSTISLDAQPNPARNSVDLQYSLRAASVIAMEIDDEVGKRVKMFDLGFQSDGSHTFTLDVSLFSSGIYHLVLNSEHASATLKLNVIR